MRIQAFSLSLQTKTNKWLWLEGQKSKVKGQRSKVKGLPSE
jgi:hypothetical protein